MENRGNEKPRNIPISRRSCDQCRTRKIGCDRGSPCSNCKNARLDCTHSVVASKSKVAVPKQRVLISAQYEQKIDDIVETLQDVKELLNRLEISPTSADPPSQSSPLDCTCNDYRPHGKRSNLTQGLSSLVDYSVLVSRFVEDVVDDEELGDHEINVNSALISLKEFSQNPCDWNPPSYAALLENERQNSTTRGSGTMPPLETAVFIIRWAKEHSKFYRVEWLAQILPLETYGNICQKIYFAVDEFTDSEYVIANAFLFWLFSEYFVLSEADIYRRCFIQCRQNLDAGLSRLLLLVPASLETIAALTLGGMYAIESSKAQLAWNFLSQALNFCQTLGYHTSAYIHNSNDNMREVKSNLFWLIYAANNGLSLRLGRTAFIQDADITLPPAPDETRCVKTCRVQGKVYRFLYSPAGLATPESERIEIARSLASEVQEMIKMDNFSFEEVDPLKEQMAYGGDKLRGLYLRADIIIRYSLLSHILRLIPPNNDFLRGNSNKTKNLLSTDCVSAAYDVLAIHEQCTKILHTNAPFMMTRYLAWTMMHTPFVPFIIIFQNSLQNNDKTELARLERFTASLKPSNLPSYGQSQPITAPPHRLFELLCQVARDRIETNEKAMSTQMGGTLTPNQDFDFSSFYNLEKTFPRFEPNGEINGNVYFSDSQQQELENWYQEQLNSNLFDDQSPLL